MEMTRGERQTDRASQVATSRERVERGRAESVARVRRCTREVESDSERRDERGPWSEIGVTVVKPRDGSPRCICARMRSLYQNRSRKNTTPLGTSTGALLYALPWA